MGESREPDHQPRLPQSDEVVDQSSPLLEEQTSLPIRAARTLQQSWLTPQGELDASRVIPLLNRLADSSGEIRLADADPDFRKLCNALFRHVGPGKRFPGTTQSTLQAFIDVHHLPYSIIRSQTNWLRPDGSLDPARISDELTVLAVEGQFLRPSAVKVALPGLWNIVYRTQPDKYPHGLQSLVDELGLPYRVVSERGRKLTLPPHGGPTPTYERGRRWVRQDGSLNREEIERGLSEVAGEDGTFTAWQVGAHHSGLYLFVTRNTGPGQRFPNGFQSLIDELGLPLRLTTGHTQWVLDDGSLNRSGLVPALESILEPDGTVRPGRLKQSHSQLYQFLLRNTGSGRRFPRGLESLMEELELPYQVTHERLSKSRTKEASKGFAWGGKWLDEQGKLRPAVAEALLELAPDGVLVPGIIQQQASSIYDTVRKNRALFPQGLESLARQLGAPFRIERQRTAPIEWFLPDEARSLNRALILPQIQKLIGPDNQLKVRDVYAANRALYGFVQRNSGEGMQFPNGFESLVTELGLDCRVEKQEHTNWISRSGEPNRVSIEPLLASVAQEGIIQRAALDATREGENLLGAVEKRSGPGKQFPNGFQSLIDQLNLPYRYEEWAPEQWQTEDGSLDAAKIRDVLAGIAGDQTTIHAGDIRRSNVSLYNFIRRNSGPGQLFPDRFRSVSDLVGLTLTIEQDPQRFPWRIEGVLNHSFIVPLLVAVVDAHGSFTPIELIKSSREGAGLYHWVFKHTGRDNLFPNGLQSLVEQLQLPYTVVRRRKGVSSRARPVPSVSAKSERKRRLPTPGERVDFSKLGIDYEARHFTTVVDDRLIVPSGPTVHRSETPSELLTEEIDDLTTGMSLTGAEQLRLLIARTKDRWRSPEAAALYAEYVGELPSYVVHRARIAFLVEYLFARHRTYPHEVIDLGAGPSVAYQAYCDLEALFQAKELEPPQVTDIDSSLAMLEQGMNPDRIAADVAERLPIATGSVELVESSYVLHHFEPAAIRRTLAEAHRVLRWGTYLVLTSPVRFSRSFLRGVRLLGFDVDTVYGTRLAADRALTDTLTESYGKPVADRLLSKLEHSYLLVAQKNHPIDMEALPTSEWFSFDHPTGVHPSWQVEQTSQSLIARDVRGRVDELLGEVGRALDQLQNFTRVHDELFRYDQRPLTADEQRHYRGELQRWLDRALDEHVRTLAHVRQESVDHLTWRQLALLREKIHELSAKLD